jgi:outer membrane protein OmpA-like peptidoglycan-associated protein
MMSTTQRNVLPNWIKPATGALALALVLSACSLKKDESASDETVDQATPSAPQTVAPGADITSAAPAKIGMTIDGEIKQDGPSDFYKFENPGKLRDIVVVRLENKSATLRPDIKIYNSERSQLFERYDGTAGANVEQAVSLDPGQALYVQVLPYNSAGAYQLSAIAQKAYDQYEANDDVIHPATLTFGNTLEASVLDNKDEDWYHITAPTMGKVAIGFENLSATLRPDIKVYSASKSQLVEKYDGTPGAGLDFTVDVQPGQDFYVQILPYNSKGKYRLSTRPAALAGDLQRELSAKGVVDVYGVYFDVDQTFLKPESSNTIAEVAAMLKANPALRLEVAGHTDGDGTAAHNMTLSQGRAQAVVSSLVGQYGIDASRLVAKGYGDSKPIAANDTPTNKAKNRRVELKRL